MVSRTTQTQRKGWRSAVIAATLAIGTGLVGLGVSAPWASGSSGAPGHQAGPRTIWATPLAKVATPGDLPRVLLEGGTFGPDGDFYFVWPTAPAGKSLVLALNVRTKALRTVYASTTQTFAAAQFSPTNGKLYLADFRGSISRVDANGSGFTLLVSGEVLGSRSVFDDLTFDRSGAMYATDMRGTPWAPAGRVIRFDEDGSNPVLLLDKLASPNGISFDPTYTQLWISEWAANRESVLNLSADRKSVTEAHIAMTANVGNGQFDSNAIDSAGNIYQAIEHGAKVLVWNPDGTLLAEIKLRIPPGIDGTLSTNLAIRPGTKDGYIVTGGREGGYVYEFKALAVGGAQSNGGGTP